MGRRLCAAHDRFIAADARQRLLDTATVNYLGEISSYRISDIRSELSPSEAYAVFSLFGTPELAGHVNNGQVNSQQDAAVKALDDGKRSLRAHPYEEGYYCNAGWCTKNEQMTCSNESCQRVQ